MTAIARTEAAREHGATEHRGAAPERARLLGVAASIATFLAYLPGLGRSLEYDAAETVGYFIKPGPPWVAFQRQVIFNNHPAFSFLEQLVRVATGRTDAATLRLLPIALAAAAVGVLVWHCARRWGTVAGLAGGLVVAANPTFQSLAREVRGYSLLCLCGIVTTVVVIDEVSGRRPSRGRDAVYVIAGGVGLATHLFMLPVLVVQTSVIVATKRFDEARRRRLLVIAVIAAAAYAGMAGAMVDASAKHERLFQPALPFDIAKMALGGGAAALVLAPLVILGLVAVASHRAGRVALITGAVVFVGLWVVQQSSALDPRFFVWVVPGVGYLAALGVSRMRPASVLAVGAAALMIVSFAGSYRDDPTSYRTVAPVVRAAHAAGARTCVVDVGVAAMTGYLDEGREFTPVTDTAQLDACDVVVVAAWWHLDTPWYANDARIIDAATARFPVQTVFPSHDPILVLSSRPLSSWGG